MTTNHSANRTIRIKQDSFISRGFFGACCLYLGIALAHIDAIRNIPLSYLLYFAIGSFLLSWLARK